MERELPILDDMLQQVAVYWVPGPRGADAEPTFSTGVEIFCRWDERSDLFLDRKTNEQQISKARVIVDRDVKEEGYLWLSSIRREDYEEGLALEELVDQDTPQANSGAWVIRRFDKRPVFDAGQFWRAAWL